MTAPRLLDILTRRDNSVPAHLTRFGLALLRPGYAAATSTRNAMFDSGFRKIHRLNRPVLSVGNLTTGGTGKTPFVISLAQHLLSLNIRPAVLLRGYRAEPRELIQSSDEADVLRDTLGDEVPVEPDPDRVAAAQRVLVSHPDIHLFLLDDGFQHRRVHRNLDIVLIDATRPFGCDLPLPDGYTHAAQLPLGLLRESPHSLLRADALVVTRADEVEPHQQRWLDDIVERLTGRPPIARVAHRWHGLLDHHNTHTPLETLRSLRVAAICGVANPKPFINAVRRHAAHLALACPMRDHQPYDHKQINELLEQARHAGAQAILLTEKDWVKWRSVLKNPPLPIYRPVLAIEYLLGENDLLEMVHELVKPAIENPART